MLILLAEDNPVNQKVALRMLSRMGHEADVAQNGREAIEALEKKPYDVILMDMQMPEMDGLEASRLIVEVYPEELRPFIIALTANAMQGDRERCIAAGMNDYISKPIRIEDLKEAFARVPVREMGNGTSANSDPEAANAAIDHAVLQELLEMLGNDFSFASGLIGDFLVDGDELVNNVRASLETGDVEEFMRASHTLKSSAATFGAMTTSRLCKEIEEMGQQGNLGEIAADKTTALEEAYRQARQELERFVTTMPVER
ncbi:MAG: response regulator [Rhodothermales bacterium]|nr:response regulator [Rhodothermales bacterium]